MLDKPIDETLAIRLGVPEDLAEIMELAKLSTDENAFLPPDMSKIAQAIWPALHLDKGLVGVITSDPSRIEGVVILHIGEMWYASQDNPILEEKVIFIHPDYRSARGGRARKLCQFSKHVSDELGMPLIIGVLSGQRTKGKIRMYQREFGEPQGAFFLHNCQTGAPNGAWTADADADIPAESISVS